jgi:cobalamin biosynthesis protein CbiD
MIRRAVLEAIETSDAFAAGTKQDKDSSIDRVLEVTISVPEGRQLAKKPLTLV